MTDINPRIVLSGEDRSGPAFAQAKRNISALQSSASALSATFRSIGPLLGAGLVAGLARGAVNGLDALNDLKDATGSSIENLSALEDIAARTGTKFDTVGTSLVKFNAVLSDSKPGSQAANILQAIGLNAEELKRIDPAEALRRAAVGMAQFADDGSKARAVQELFGKSTREVAPFLADLAKQGKLNATSTTEQADAAERFKKELAELNKNMQDVARTLVGEVLPALNDFFDRLKGNSKAGGFFASIGKEIEANLASDKLRVAVDSIENVQALLNKDPGNVVLLTQMRDLRAEAEKLSRDAMRASDALKGFAAIANPLQPRENAGGGRGFVNPEIQKPSLSIPEIAKPRATSGGTSERVSEVERYLEGLRKQLEGTRQLTVVEQVLADVEARRIKGISAATTGKALDLAAQIDATIARTKLLAEEQQSREAGARLMQQNLSALAQEAAQLVEGNEALRDEIQIISGGEQARRNIEQARLSSAIALKQDTLAMLENAGASATEIDLLRQQINLLTQRAQLLGNVGAAVDLAKDLDKQAANAERFVDILANGAGDAVANFSNLRSVIASVGQQLLQLSTQLLIVNPAKEYLTGLVKPGKAGGGLPDLVGDSFIKLFGLSSGGYTGNAGEAEPAGVVHGKEFVFSAPAVRRLGVKALENLHAAAKSGAPQLPGYQQGGYVGMPAPARAVAASTPAARGGDTFVDMRGLSVNSNGYMDRMAEDRAAQRVARLAERYITRRGA